MPLDLPSWLHRILALSGLKFWVFRKYIRSCWFRSKGMFEMKMVSPEASPGFEDDCFSV
jgi:hypothetical protein